MCHQAVSDTACFPYNLLCPEAPKKQLSLFLWWLPLHPSIAPVAPVFATSFRSKSRLLLPAHSGSPHCVPGAVLKTSCSPF